MEVPRVRQKNDAVLRPDLGLEIVVNIVAAVYLFHPVVRADLRCLVDSNAEPRRHCGLCRPRRNLGFNMKTDRAGSRRKNPGQRSFIDRLAVFLKPFWAGCFPERHGYVLDRKSLLVFSFTALIMLV